MTGSVAVHEGAKTKRVSRIVGVVLRQLHKALMGDGAAAIAVMKIASQLGLLEEGTSGEIVLSREDEQILSELVARTQKN
jgi:hypothetical protein